MLLAATGDETWFGPLSWEPVRPSIALMIRLSKRDGTESVGR